MKAAPDADSSIPDPGADPKGTKPPAWKPSGALSNPDPSIEDMPLDEYNLHKEAFFQPCAKNPKMDGGHQCSLLEGDHPEGSFYQETKASAVSWKEITQKEMMGLPILSVSGCMFICKCRCVCVCVVDCACMINNVVLVPLPG